MAMPAGYDDPFAGAASPAAGNTLRNAFAQMMLRQGNVPPGQAPVAQPGMGNPPPPPGTAGMGSNQIPPQLAQQPQMPPMMPPPPQAPPMMPPGGLPPPPPQGVPLPPPAPGGMPPPPPGALPPGNFNLPKSSGKPKGKR
jgi:hypothetical protein